MKTKSKFLFAGLALTLALGALAPTTAKADHGSCNAGYYSNVFVGYDACGRPVYQTVWVPVYTPPPPRPVYPSYGNGHSYGGPSCNTGGGFGFSPGNGGFIHLPGLNLHFGNSGSSHRQSSSHHHHHGH